MHNYEQFSRNADIAIRERLSDAIELNLRIAARPETGGNEHFACAAHTEFLRHAGFMVETPFCGIPTAFCATAGSGFPVVALLAEYDALPLIGHGCGHCLHGSMSSLAGAALLPLMAELGGTLRVVGTPAEETNGAKVTMAKMGVFDDAALAVMIHCNDVTSFVRYRSLAMDAPEFTFTGMTAHAAGAPWEGRNALNGATLFLHAMDMLRQHVRPEIRMHGVITDGGTAPNIVPDRAVVRCYARAPERTQLDALMKRIDRCASGAAMATETDVSRRLVEFSFDDTKPNEPAETMMESVFSELGVPIVPAPGPIGSSDVGNVSHRCPALQPHLAITDVPTPHHTRQFAEASSAASSGKALELGARILARAALRVFLDRDLCEALQKDYRGAGSRIPRMP